MLDILFYFGIFALFGMIMWLIVFRKQDTKFISEILQRLNNLDNDRFSVVNDPVINSPSIDRDEKLQEKYEKFENYKRSESLKNADKELPNFEARNSPKKYLNSFSSLNSFKNERDNLRGSPMRTFNTDSNNAKFRLDNSSTSEDTLKKNDFLRKFNTKNSYIDSKDLSKDTKEFLKENLSKDTKEVTKDKTRKKFDNFELNNDTFSSGKKSNIIDKLDKINVINRFNELNIKDDKGVPQDSFKIPEFTKCTDTKSDTLLKSRNTLLKSDNNSKGGKFVCEDICRKYLEKRFNKPFPNTKPDWLRNPLTNRKLELDCYNQELKIAVEYNGIQHYVWPSVWFKTREEFDKQVFRDMYKEKVCKDRGIIFITVPYTIPKADIESFLEKSLNEQLH